MTAADRRERFVEAAIRVMTRDGVGHATTRAIAAEADMPLGMFHYVFESKRELIALVAEKIARQSKSEIDAAVLQREGIDDLVEVILDGMCAYFDHVVAHPHDHLVTYELTTTALRDADLEDAAKRQYDYYLRENEGLLAAAAELLGVEFTEPLPVVSRLVFSLMDGLALNWLARGDEEEAREVLRLAARILLPLARPRQSG